MPKRLNKFSNIAVSEVKSLTDYGYRVYGQLEAKSRHTVFLKHSNGNKARVVLSPASCEVFINFERVSFYS